MLQMAPQVCTLFTHSQSSWRSRLGRIASRLRKGQQVYHAALRDDLVRDVEDNA